MKILLPEIRGYHAAAIDGEGSINISRRNNNTYNLNISISNTNISFLLYLKTSSGIGTVYPHTSKTITHKATFTWGLKRHEMKEYLLQIKDILIIKKQQAELMLEFFPLISCQHNRNNHPSEENLVMREVIWEEISELNKRGPNDNRTLAISG